MYMYFKKFYTGHKTGLPKFSYFCLAKFSPYCYEGIEVCRSFVDENILYAYYQFVKDG